MSRKIVFLDIDGTLTEPGCNEPPDSARKAVADARAAGHIVFLCTGRNYGMLSPLLQYGFDGYIASSGGYVVCGGKVVYDSPMTENQQKTAMDVLKQSGIFRTVECMEGSYTDEGLKEFLQSNIEEGQNSELLRWREQIERSLHILPMKEYAGQPVYKIVIMCQSKEQLVLPRRVLEPDFAFCMQAGTRCGMINGEILSRKFDKGKALEQVCGEYDIPVSDAIAIGDSENDREMIEAAGIGICMDNGSEALKRLADDVCPSVHQDGVYRAFLKYHLI